MSNKLKNISLIKNINSVLCTYGVNIRKILLLPRIIFKYLKDIKKFKLEGGKINYYWPIYYEDNGNCSSLSDYSILSFIVIQDIFKRRISNHFDIGSAVEKFIIPLSAAGVKVTLLDIRKTNFLDAFNITNEVFDACNVNKVNSILSKNDEIKSISCIHAIEHFGLGRYGDNIDPYAQQKFIFNISRILQKNSIFYLGMPIGNNDIYFNAHRMMSLEYYKNLVLDFFDIEAIFLINPNSSEKFIKFKNSDFNKELQKNNHIAALFVLIRK